jgi:hypothetical protein
MKAQQIIESRRVTAYFIPIAKPRKKIDHARSPGIPDGDNIMAICADDLKKANIYSNIIFS